MQCPNCRKVEKGRWLYANGCHFPDFGMDEWTYDDDTYDSGHSEMVSSFTLTCSLFILLHLLSLAALYIYLFIYLFVYFSFGLLS